MTTTANAAQFDAWNGDSGVRWVATADRRDRVLAPVADALLAAAALTVGTDVLDVGCGCGATTLTAATQVGGTGSVAGIDLSAPMLHVARQRAAAAGATNTGFVQGDAQTFPFEPRSVDVVISRFGTMFFSDPETAFTNIATALRPGGRLCLATWQPLAANQWLATPGAAVLHCAEMPASASNEPGMFGQSDPDLVTTTLRAAGFTDIGLEAKEIPLELGETVEAAADYLTDSGPGRALLEAIPEGADRYAAFADLHAVLEDHHDGSGVRLNGGIWILTASRRRLP